MLPAPQDLPPGVHKLPPWVVSESTCLGLPTHGEANAKLDPKNAIINWPPDLCNCEDQTGATCLGPVFAYSYVCRSCSCNAVNAFINRHGARQPVCASRFPGYPQFISSVRSAYAVLGDVYDTWEDRWPMAKLRDMWASFWVDEYRPDRVSAFVKREGGHKAPTKARLIQANPNYRTQMHAARQHATFQKALCLVCSVEGYEIYSGIFITVGSGLNSAELGRWMDITSAVSSHYYERDGKNWDSTMQLIHHEVKLSFMRACDPTLADSVDDARVVVGAYSRRGSRFRYKLVGTVKSGHNDTTSGNSLINSLILAECMLRLGLKGRIIVAGDDALVGVTTDFDVGSFMSAEASFGIIPEAAKFSSPADVSFISAIWLPSRSGYLFVPVLGRLLARLWWTTNPPSQRRLTDYQFSVAAGLRPAVGCIPLYREFLAACPRVGQLIETGKWLGYKHAFAPADDWTYQSIMDRYGFGVGEMGACADFLSTLDMAPAIISHPLVDRILARDLCEIDERAPWPSHSHV